MCVCVFSCIYTYIYIELYIYIFTIIVISADPTRVNGYQSLAGRLPLVPLTLGIQSWCKPPSPPAKASAILPRCYGER